MKTFFRSLTFLLLFAVAEIAVANSVSFSLGVSTNYYREANDWEYTPQKILAYGLGYSWTNWGLSLEFSQNNMETGEGLIDVKSEEFRSELWGRYLPWWSKLWTPYLGVALAATRTNVLSQAGTDTDSVEGPLEAQIGGSLGIRVLMGPVFFDVEGKSFYGKEAKPNLGYNMRLGLQLAMASTGQ